MMLQYHDEIASYLLLKDKEKHEVLLKEAINAVNDVVKLNVPLGVSVDFGDNYAKIH